MSRLAKGFGQLELLPLCELLEIHERIEKLIDERSDSASSKNGRNQPTLQAQGMSCRLSKKIRLTASKYRDLNSDVLVGKKH